MKRTVLSIAVTCILSTTAIADDDRYVCPEPVQPVMKGYAGITLAKTTGRIGMIGLYRMCQAEYGPDAIMCRRTDVWDTPRITDEDTSWGHAWTRPEKGLETPIPILSYGKTKYFEGTDCNAWHDDNPNGQNLRMGLTIGGADYCHKQLSVACCY